MSQCPMCLNCPIAFNLSSRKLLLNYARYLQAFDPCASACLIHTEGTHISEATQLCDYLFELLTDSKLQIARRKRTTKLVVPNLHCVNVADVNSQ